MATLGALALAPTPLPEVTAATAQPIVRSGFEAIDGLIGGLPSQGTVSLVGDPCSGTTTLALRSMAEAQASGAIGAWLDLPGRFDPLEAAARGVDLRWLVVVRPVVATDGLRIAGSLLGSRSVDLLVLDLPPRRACCASSRPTPGGWGRASSPSAPTVSLPRSGMPSPRPATCGSRSPIGTGCGWVARSWASG